VIAIISDIHANLEALRAVLADIAEQGARTIYCLGDVVGYGPNPRECLDLVMDRAAMTVLGNHDQAALFDPAGFTAAAERAIFWTRRQLETSPEPAAARERRWEFLALRPWSFKDGGRLFVHGSARNPLNEYVFPEDTCNQPKMERIFALVARHVFQGHTHVPGVFVAQGDSYVFHRPEETGGSYRLDGEKVMVNVGSVGQPRDGDEVRYRRVEYEREATIAKMLAVPDLDVYLSERLRRGQ
jgi:predicted phosphodiesterase